MNLISRILLSALVLLIVAYYVPGITVDSVYIAVVTAIVLGGLNAIVRPILIILTLPITLITLGLFTFVINAFLFLFAASFIDGFTVDGFLLALLGSFILTLASTAADELLE